MGWIISSHIMQSQQHPLCFFYAYQTPSGALDQKNLEPIMV